ncbi:hypothetical protein [Azospirillum sp. sgz302134]
MSEKEHQFRRLNSIFNGDGKEIREQLVFAGLLLTIFERFKKYVIDQVDGYFSDNIDFVGGELKYKRGAEFKKIIKENGRGQPGQHGNEVFRAAMHWFHSLNAIDSDEFHEIERLYTIRNEIGHELFRIVADDGKTPITLFDVIFALGVYVKIVRWWVKEVEATTDPDMDEHKYDSIDWDNVESSDTIILREILKKALSDNQQWQELQRAVDEHFSA